MFLLWVLTEAMKPSKGGRRRSSGRSRSVKAYKPKGKSYTVYYR